MSINTAYVWSDDNLFVHTKQLLLNKTKWWASNKQAVYMSLFEKYLLLFSFGTTSNKQQLARYNLRRPYFVAMHIMNDEQTTTTT